MESLKAHVIRTFAFTTSQNPAAKLLGAIRSEDLKIPRANDIMNNLSVEEVILGLETLLDIAKLEHWDIHILKHFLRTASFAKKFTNPDQFDPNIYTNVVKHMIVLSQIRHSEKCPRAITYEQFEKYKPRKVLNLLLKYRDYKTAIALVDNLGIQSHLQLVYEDWISAMLKFSNLDDHRLA